MHTNRPGAAAADAPATAGNGRRVRAVRLLAAVAVTSATLAGFTTPSSAAPLAHEPGKSGGAAVPATGPVAGDAAQGLTAADRDLLVKVRLAGLWEMPAGQMAARKGVNPKVREIGLMINEQHGRLDALVVQAARKVGVALPDEPNADQRAWLTEMGVASGAEFDHVFVDRLRAAHGKVFPVIAAVRTGTRNAVVRQLAQQSNDFVLTHLTLLESTGLVDWSKLPLPPAPAAAPPAGTAGGGSAAAITNAASVAGSRPWLAGAAGAAAVLALVLGGWAAARRRYRYDWDDAPRPRDRQWGTGPVLSGIRPPAPFPQGPVHRRSSTRTRP